MISCSELEIINMHHGACIWAAREPDAILICPQSSLSLIQKPEKFVWFTLSSTNNNFTQSDQNLWVKCLTNILVLALNDSGAVVQETTLWTAASLTESSEGSVIVVLICVSKELKCAERPGSGPAAQPHSWLVPGGNLGARNRMKTPPCCTPWLLLDKMGELITLDHKYWNAITKCKLKML